MLPPAAAAAPGCWSHTAAADPSSGSRVSGVDADARFSASFLPEQQTEPKHKSL